MIGPVLIAWDRVRRFLTPEGWLIVGALLLLLAFLAVAYFSGVEAQKDRQAVEVAKTQERASTGRETAATERLEDTLTNQANQKALSDAIADLPPSAPSPVRLALACERLRQQGTVLPQPCRPDGTAKAGSAR